MGAGRSQEAVYDLQASVPAGNWHVIADGIIVESVDVTFELVHRRGTADTVVASWMQHFDPRPDGDFTAVPVERDEPAAAIEYESGDQLVYRYTGNNSPMDAYFPAADGMTGRDTELTLP